MILIIGAGGQIGTELTDALRKLHGSSAVVASDIRPATGALQNGPFVQLDALDGKAIHRVVQQYRIRTICHLSAVLSANGEQQPRRSWDLNMHSLLNVLDIAREEKLQQVFWPSSIAVFGHKAPKEHCPQDAVQHPATVYGISKSAGEQWCQYYHRRYGVDVRSVRYPGLISHSAPPGGGTTDYAVSIFHEALSHSSYECYLQEDTRLPMLYMPDAIAGTLQLMEAPSGTIHTRTSYNLGGLSFSPAELATAIKKHIPGFTISYTPDYREAIARTWPASLDDREARLDWGWKPRYDLEAMTTDMIEKLVP